MLFALLRGGCFFARSELTPERAAGGGLGRRFSRGGRFSARFSARFERRVARRAEFRVARRAVQEKPSQDLHRLQARSEARCSGQGCIPRFLTVTTTRLSPQSSHRPPTSSCSCRPPGFAPWTRLPCWARGSQQYPHTKHRPHQSRRQATAPQREIPPTTPLDGNSEKIYGRTANAKRFRLIL